MKKSLNRCFPTEMIPLNKLTCKWQTLTFPFFFFSCITFQKVCPKTHSVLDISPLWCNSLRLPCRFGLFPAKVSRWGRKLKGGFKQRAKYDSMQVFPAESWGFAAAQESGIKNKRAWVVLFFSSLDVLNEQTAENCHCHRSAATQRDWWWWDLLHLVPGSRSGPAVPTATPPPPPPTPILSSPQATGPAGPAQCEWMRFEVRTWARSPTFSEPRARPRVTSDELHDT